VGAQVHATTDGIVPTRQSRIQNSIQRRRLRHGLRRPRRVGGGSWPRGGKKRSTRLDITRRRERQRDRESCYRIRKRRGLRSDTHWDWPSRRVEGILIRTRDGPRPRSAQAHVDAS
ncbi:unnamed protein product, partial [Ascophyllum nodosum]